VRLLFRIVSFHCQLANARRNENGPNHQIVCQKMLEGLQMKGNQDSRMVRGRKGVAEVREQLREIAVIAKLAEI